MIVRGTDPRLEFGQVERLVEAIDLVIGSSSAIFACGAARLGLRVAFVGVVGDDAMGRFMLDAMGARGVDVSACRVDPGTPTGASVILTRGNDRAILTAPGTVPLLRDEDVPDGLVGRARHLPHQRADLRHPSNYQLHLGCDDPLPRRCHRHRNSRRYRRNAGWRCGRNQDRRHRLS